MARIPMHIRTPLAEPEIDPRVSLVQPASLEPGSVLLDALQPKHTTDTGHESAHRRGGGDSDGGGGHARAFIIFPVCALLSPGFSSPAPFVFSRAF